MSENKEKLRPGSAIDTSNKKLADILRGDFNQLPKPLSNIVKIFLSSTFTGFLFISKEFLSEID